MTPVTPRRACRRLHAVSAPALAHVPFENGQANPNSTYKATLRIPHGCAGKPTLQGARRIPEGIVAVKPMPKAGWKLESPRAPMCRPTRSTARR